jgi:predicted amidohydrolase YtcJ
MVTVNAARLLGLEQLTGSIEVGKRADLAVLDRDPLAVPPGEIGAIEVLETVLDGETVYEAAGSGRLSFESSRNP